MDRVTEKLRPRSSAERLFGQVSTWCDCRFSRIAAFLRDTAAVLRDATAPDASPSTTTAAASTGPKILVFDLHLDDLIRCAEPFESRGFEVHKSASIEGAMRLVEREQFDFALIDQGSAAFEALRVIRHIVRYSPQTPFVVVTRVKDAQCGPRAFAIGANDYLQKPVPEAKMQWLIERTIRRAGAP
jgi:CheY-like chemotaxis protein